LRNTIHYLFQFITVTTPSKIETLYRLWETLSGDANIKQLILPESLRKEVLQQLHNSQTAGHLGVAKTLSRVKERFYWVQCGRDMPTAILSCQLVKSASPTPYHVQFLWTKMFSDVSDQYSFSHL